jgi:hypothetical protein
LLVPFELDGIGTSTHAKPTNPIPAEYCQASSNDQAAIYFSDVFESNVPPNVIVTGGIENLFGAYLKRSYGYNSRSYNPVVCQSTQSVAAGEGSKKQVQARYTMMGKQFVETRWKLSREQAATLAALPPTPQCYEHDASNPNCEQTVLSGAATSAGSSSKPGASAAANSKAIMYELCRAVTSVRTGGKYTTHFSGIMPRASINDADYSAAFAAFLAKKYGVQYVTPECGGSRSMKQNLLFKRAGITRLRARI